MGGWEGVPLLNTYHPDAYGKSAPLWSHQSGWTQFCLSAWRWKGIRSWVWLRCALQTLCYTYLTVCLLNCAIHLQQRMVLTINVLFGSNFSMGLIHQQDFSITLIILLLLLFVGMLRTNAYDFAENYKGRFLKKYPSELSIHSIHSLTPWRYLPCTFPFATLSNMN